MFLYRMEKIAKNSSFVSHLRASTTLGKIKLVFLSSLILSFFIFTCFLGVELVHYFLAPRPFFKSKIPCPLCFFFFFFLAALYKIFEIFYY